MFSSNMRNNKIYNIAIPKGDDLSTRKNFSNNSCPNSLRNIFSQDRGHKKSQSQLRNARNYEIVGMKELKSYQKRMKKTSHLTFRSQSLSSDRPLSKQSADTKIGKQKLLCREEIERNIPILLKTGKTETKIKKKGKKFTHSRHNQNSSPLETETSSFSFFRLKEKMEQRQREWKAIFKQRDSTSKFPTISQSIDQFRNTMQQRDSTTLNQNLITTISGLWPSVLRSNQNINSIISKKQNSKTLYNRPCLQLKGKGKLQQERQWIQHQEDLGYKFKQLAKNYHSPQKKIEGIR